MDHNDKQFADEPPAKRTKLITPSPGSSDNLDFKFLNDLNNDLPEELGDLLTNDILSSTTVAVTQNGIGSLDMVQPHQQLLQQVPQLHSSQPLQQQQVQVQSDVTIQNHMQLSHLLSSNVVATTFATTAAASQAGPRYNQIVSGPVTVVQNSGVNSVNVLNPQMTGGIGPTRVSLAGIMTSLGGVQSSIVTITRPGGNIALLPTGGPGLGTVVGVQRPQLQHQQTQHLSSNTTIVSGSSGVLSVGTSSGAAAAMTRLLPLQTSGISLQPASGVVQINVAPNQPGQSASALTTNGTHLNPTLAVMQRTVAPQRFTTASLQQPSVGDASLGSITIGNAAQLGIPASNVASVPLTGVRQTFVPPGNQLRGGSPQSVMVAGPGPSPSATADPEKRRLIQQQLVLLLHAHKCQRREQVNGTTGSQPTATTGPNAPCQLPHCQTMKNVLKHMSECHRGKQCKVPHCASSRQIITHWKNCTRNDCPVCLPLKNAGDRRTGGQAITGMTTPNQQNVVATSPNVVSPNQQPNAFLPPHADMVRAYAALGLTPPTPQQQQNIVARRTGTLPSAALGRPPGAQQWASAGVGNNQTVTLFADGTSTAVSGSQVVHLVSQSSLNMAVGSNTSTQQASINAVTSGASGVMSGLIADAAQPRPPAKDWHQSVTQDLRNHLVHKLVQAIFPTPDITALRDRRINNLVQYARKVEGDMYETANSREEYYHLLAEKIYKIQKELEEKRLKRMQDQNVTGSNAVPGASPPPVTAVLRPALNGPVASTGTAVFSVTTQQRPTGPADQSPGAVLSSLVNRSDPLGQLQANQTSVGQISVGSELTSNIVSAPGSVTMAQQLLQDVLAKQREQMDQKSVFTSGTAQSVPRFTLQTSTVTTSPLLTQQLIQPSAQTQQLGGNSSLSAIVPQPSSQSLGGPSPLSSPPMQPLVKAPTPGMPLSVGSASSYTMSATPTQSAVTNVNAVGVKTEYNASTPNDLLQTLMADVKVEPKTELTNSFLTEDDSKLDVASIGAMQQIDQSSGEQEGGPSSTSADMEDCSTPANSSLLGSSLDVKPDVSSTMQLNHPKPVAKKVWKGNELRQALMPTLEKLYRLEPESLPFRQPVDPVMLQIPDYFEIIKKPMDLSLIKRKLDTGQYTDPWQYVEDVWLMFDNAWLYNRKSSKVHKNCSKLAEVFEAEIDPVMKMLGFCCGRKYVFCPQVLICYGKQLCTVPVNATYYSYQNRYAYCEKCFLEIAGDEVELVDDPTQPSTRISKSLFKKTKNSELEAEQFVECTYCGRKQHTICALHMEQIWPNEFVCAGCCAQNNIKRKENKYTAKRLPQTKLGTYLENRVNSFLKRKDAGAGEVTIRVLCSSEKVVEVRPGMKARFCTSTADSNAEMADSFPYLAKAIFAFEEIEGIDVCFFGMHVQEYGSNCPPPNTRRIYLAYMDSVHFFQPRNFRTAVYHEILIGYLDYVKLLGYTMAHIWACPPSEGDDYIFHCHPTDMKIPKPKRLQDWYKKMLDKAIIERVVIDYKDVLKDAIENNVQSATEMPYFEGDFWPNILEESIKELEQEEEDKRKREEVEAAASTAEVEEQAPEKEETGEVAGGKKKGQKSAVTKKKSTKSKNTAQRKGGSKSNQPYAGNDLTTKLFATMEKHKEVFFVIRLQSLQAAPQHVRDPDPLVSNDLMDGRDAFLMTAREKHYEFSTLRRAKFSSMAMLYELHTQGRDNFVYTCNACKANMETHYHCSTCDDFDLCIPCYNKEQHPHKMERIGLDLDDGANAGGSSDGPTNSLTQNPAEARRLSIQRCIQSLVHACQCRDANCRLPSCQKMKRVMAHSRNCRRKTNGGCPVCKQLIALCCYHAKHCPEVRCPVPFCITIKQKLKQQQLQARLVQQQLMNRRMAQMRGSVAPSAAVPSTPPSIYATIDHASSLGGKPAAIAVTAVQAVARNNPSVVGGSAMLIGQPVDQASVVGQRQADGSTSISLQPVDQKRNLLALQGQPRFVVASTQPANKQPVILQNPQAIAALSQQIGTQGGAATQTLTVGLRMPEGVGNVVGQLPTASLTQQSVVVGASQQPARLPTVQTVGDVTALTPGTVHLNITQGQQLQQQQPQQQGQLQQHQATLQRLLQTLKSPSSPGQQQQVLNILKTNPQLMATFLKQRQMQMNIHKQQQQQQQGQQQAQPAVQTSSTLVSGIITQQQAVPVVQHDTTQTVALHSLQTAQQQHQHQANLIVLNKTPQGVVTDGSTVSAGVSPQMLQQFRLQSSQIIQQHQQMQHQNVTAAAIRAGTVSSVQNSTSQYSLAQPQQQMIIIRQQQPVIVVSAAAGTSTANALQAQQQMLTLQQNSIRPLSATALNRTVLPAGINQMPRQPAAGTAHFLTARQQHPLSVTLNAGATILTAQTSSSGASDQTVMLTPQQQQHAGVNSMPGFGLNLDLAGLNSAGQLVKSDGDVTPLTPQDQLSRYVDQL